MAPNDYSFSDLVDLDIILDVIQRFYRLTNFPPSITDPEGNLLLTVGFKSICGDFHRRHPETKRKCQESDTRFMQDLNKDGSYACYNCLNGLTDLALPVVIDGQHLANLFVGQFFMDQSPDRDFFRKQAEEYGFDVDAYMTAVDKVPVFTREQVEQAASFLTGLAQLIGEMGLTQKRLALMNEDLEAAVRERTGQLKHESVKRQRALAEFEAIFNNSSVGIVQVKGLDFIHNVNKRFEDMFGYDKGEVLGRRLKLLSPDFQDHEQRMERHRAIYENGGLVHEECELVARDGSLIWCSYQGKAVNPPDLDHGIILIIDDISERKELEALKEDVDRIMRHDLKAPLNGIIGFAQYLLMDDNLRAEQSEALQDILASGLRMTDQINRSLEIYKIETGTFRLLPAPTDMGAVTASALRHLSHPAKLKRLTIDINVGGLPFEDARPIRVMADETLSCTMMSNLIKNSVEAAPEGSTITISLTERDGLVSVAVHNQGAVPPDIRDRFFEKYVTSRKTSGTGLGTYTAKLMAEAQNGQISMRSSEEAGTTVTIVLPGVPGEGPNAQPLSEPAAAPRR